MAEEKVEKTEKVVFELRVLDDGEGNFRVEMRGDKKHLKHLRHMGGFGMGPGGHFGMRHHARRAFRRRMMRMHAFRHGYGRGYGYGGPCGSWDEEDEPVDV